MDDIGDRLLLADADCRGFAAFESWRDVSFDEILWNDGRALLDVERTHASPPALDEAVRRTLREAAITTGAVEGLYQADRGFSFGVAAQQGDWETEIATEGPHVRRLFEAQLAALDLVVDAASGRTPISEAWIRRLHEEICREQETYDVRTPVGAQKHPLPKGVYKREPNHVRQRDGTTHAYCPVALTAPEMHRLVTEIAGSSFAAAHPVLQAAYAHYAFVSVHPFSDGNGRVARAVASVFTYRANAIPLIVHADQREEYFDALQDADRGNVAPFVGFVLRAAVDTMQQLTLALRRARLRDPGDAVREIADLYASPTRAPDPEIEAAASRIAALLRDEVQRQLKVVAGSRHLHALVQLVHPRRAASDPERWRHPSGRASLVLIDVQSAPPAIGSAGVGLSVVVAREAGSRDVIRIERAGEDVLTIRRDHLERLSTPWFRGLLESWVEIQIGELLRDLKVRAAATLRTSRG